MARAIFLTLLAGNLVLFGWHLTVNEGSQARASVADAMQAPMLSLVHENSTARGARAVTGDDGPEGGSDSATDSEPVTRRCLSLGPFKDDEEFADAQMRLGALGLEGSKRRAQGQVWVGYWIFLPPSVNRAEAISKVEALRAKGVKDIYIEPAGERENAISLGVFSERQRAQRRFREIKAMQFEPQIARRNRQGTVYWLDFVPDDSVRINPSDFQASSGRIVRLASRNCQ